MWDLVFVFRRRLLHTDRSNKIAEILLKSMNALRFLLIARLMSNIPWVPWQCEKLAALLLIIAPKCTSEER